MLENIIPRPRGPKRARAFLNMGESEKRIRAHLRRLRLPLLTSTRPRRAACPHCGQQQQVESVKVLFTNADIIILDEPTAVLPPRRWRDWLRPTASLVKQGKTIISRTHEAERGHGDGGHHYGDEKKEP